ncbi:MAG TPA: EamA family transporter [Usitatibacter sp.]|nr:EamA family transporter [Usitatibacter sp.]
MGNLRLFVACVAIWGTTWLAIKYQLGRVAPEASVSYRFFLASFLIACYCRLRKLPLRFPAREHLWIALFGVLLFGVSYVFVYHAERHVVSGLVAVGYSASPLLGALGMRLFFGVKISRRVALGSLMGIAGIVLVFWPEFSRLRGDGDTAVGAMFTVAAVVLSALGTLTAHRNNEARLPLWQTMAWGMFYGALFSLGATLASGDALTFEATPGYVLSLLYLSILGSVAAFAAYLTLVRNVGAARAGYTGVMVPIVALVVSAAFEGFHWTMLTWAGIAVSVSGNVIILRRK